MITQIKQNNTNGNDLTMFKHYKTLGNVSVLTNNLYNHSNIRHLGQYNKGDIMTSIEDITMLLITMQSTVNNREDSDVKMSRSTLSIHTHK